MNATHQTVTNALDGKTVKVLPGVSDPRVGQVGKVLRTELWTTLHERTLVSHVVQFEDGKTDGYGRERLSRLD